MQKIGHFWVKRSNFYQNTGCPYAVQACSWVFTQILGRPFGHVDGWLPKKLVAKSVAFLMSLKILVSSVNINIRVDYNLIHKYYEQNWPEYKALRDPYEHCHECWGVADDWHLLPQLCSRLTLPSRLSWCQPPTPINSLDSILFCQFEQESFMGQNIWRNRDIWHLCSRPNPGIRISVHWSNIASSCVSIMDLNLFQYVYKCPILYVVY